MVQGEALGAAILGDLPHRVRGWAGPWDAGVRPGLGARAGVRAGAAVVAREKGSMIR